jgi:hypothetical protein
LLNGNELIDRFHLPQSPLFGTLLRKVEEGRLAGAIHSREQAMAWVAEYLASKKTP